MYQKAKKLGEFNKPSLAKVIMDLLGKNVCKVEQISNWERRPLRQSQLHYAYSDAQILVEVLKKLLDLQELNPKPLDNRALEINDDEQEEESKEFQNLSRDEVYKPIKIAVKYENFKEYV